MTITGNAPVPIAVPVDEARAFLRLGAAEDEVALMTLLASASAACEAATGHVLVAREMREMIDVDGAWQRLESAPVQAITMVEGLPAEGSAFALPAQSYAIEIDRFGEGWVRILNPGAAGRVRVTLLAGVADSAGDVPAALRQGIMQLAAQWLRARDGDAAGAAAPAPDDLVMSLWRPWRRVTL